MTFDRAWAWSVEERSADGPALARDGGARRGAGSVVDGDPIPSGGFRFEQFCVRATHEAFGGFVQREPCDAERGGHRSQRLLLGADNPTFGLQFVANIVDDAL